MRSLALLCCAVLLQMLPASTHAQQVYETISSDGSIAASGSYDAAGSSTAEGTFSRSGTYDASVTFSTTVTLTAVDALAITGSFSVDGQFTASVSTAAVAPFDAIGSFTGGGTFTATGYTVSGSFTLTSPEPASGSFSGAGTYDLVASTASADGTYDGTAQTSESGEVTINGAYGGSGSIALTPAAIATQITLPTNLLGGIASTAGLGPIAATAIETRAPAANPLGTSPGTFMSAGALPESGIVPLVWNGGSVSQLSAAATALDATSATVFVDGSAVVLIPGAPAFVNASFNAHYPDAAVASGTIVLLLL